jgi:hypothetical protein
MHALTCVWRHPVNVTGLLLSPKMPYLVLFHLEWCIIDHSGRIIAGDHLIFFFIFSLLIGNVQHCLLCFLLFNFSPHSINFLFHSISIYTSFYFSQFSHSIAISHMFGFSFRSSFFNISNFILGTFIEFFFQFHPPIKFSVIIIIIILF